MNSSAKKYFVFFIILLVLEILDFSFSVHLINYSSSFKEGNLLVARLVEDGHLNILLTYKIIVPLILFLYSLHILKQKWIDQTKWFLKALNVGWGFLILIHFIVVVELGVLIWF